MKKLAKIFGGLIALVIVTGLAVPLFISSDTLKAQLVAQVKKATGRTLIINGKTSVTLFPTIAVSAQDITLGNPQGFSTAYFVTVKKLETGAALLPLLHGELIVNGITLDGATINLEQAAAGKNWEFTAEHVQDSAAKAATVPEAQKQSGSPLKRFALGDVEIKNGAINVLNPGRPPIAVRRIEATIKGADADSPLKIEASADYKNEKVSMSLDLADTKPFLNGEFSAVAASVKLPGAAADFKGQARMKNGIAAKGDVHATVSSLDTVMDWATGKPATSIVPDKLSLTTTLDYADNVARLTNLSIGIDNLKAQGTLAINHGGAVPSISGSLALSAINLDALLGNGSSATGAAGVHSVSNGNGSPGVAVPPANSDWDNTPVDLSGLNAANADLDLTWPSLKSGKFAMGSAASHLALSNGNLALTLKKAQLYGGEANGTLRASPRNIGVDMTVSNTDIDALMTALSGTSRLRGRATLALRVVATGNSQRAWMSSLNGEGSLAVRDGALKGINIGRFLRDAKKGFLSDSEAESTDFTELGGSFAVTNGVLENHDLAMKSPALRVTGSGSASLAAKTIDYRLVPTIAGTSKGQGGQDAVGGLTVPLLITGSWQKPAITPDLAGMLRDPAALKQNLKDLKGTLKNYNSVDDIGKALLGGKAAAPVEGASAAPLSKKQQRQQMLQQGLGGLLNGLQNK